MTISDILSGPARRQAKRLRDAMLRRERIAAERAEARAAVKAVRAAKSRELVAGVIERSADGRWRIAGQRGSYSRLHDAMLQAARLGLFRAATAERAA